MARKSFYWALLIILAGIIFILSAQPAHKSNELSKGLTKKIVEIVVRYIPLEADAIPKVDLLDQLNNIVRKFAHAAAYFILGILSVNAFMRSSMIGNKAYLFSIIFCILYAISDEVHQVFVAGRGCQLQDVLIDSAGAILGVGLVWVIKSLSKMNGANHLS